MAKIKRLLTDEQYEGDYAVLDFYVPGIGEQIEEFINPTHPKVPLPDGFEPMEADCDS